MTHTVESIKNLLRTNDKAVARALVALYKRQTEDEQNTESTRHSNGEGFTAAHASIGSSMAKFYLENNFLTKKQIDYWRKPTEKRGMRIELYANQLLRIANQKS
jgi:hypothetical protein